MSNYNIEKYRKKTNRKQFVRRMLSSILFFLFMIAVVCLGVLYFKEKQLDSERDRSFPMSLKGETVYDMDVCDGNLVITAQANNIYLRLDPIKQTSLQHGFSTPIVATADKYILTYDLGGYELTLGVRNKDPESLKTTTQILFCEVNQNGDVAVVTSGEHSANTVTIYDKNLKQILKYDVDDYVMALDFTRNGCVFAAQNAENGNDITNVYQLNYQKEKVEWKTTVFGLVPYSLQVTKSRDVLLVGNGQLVTLSSKGEKLGSVAFSGLVKQICHHEDTVVLALQNAMNLNDTDLQVYSAEGTLKKELTIPSSVVDLFCDEEGILFLDKKQVISYSYDLKEQGTYTFDENYTDLVRTEDIIYVMGNDEITYLSPND